MLVRSTTAVCVKIISPTSTMYALVLINIYFVNIVLKALA